MKKKCKLLINVDPSLIGGIVIKYDSNLMDYSVLGALKKIEKTAIKKIKNLNS